MKREIKIEIDAADSRSEKPKNPQHQTRLFKINEIEMRFLKELTGKIKLECDIQSLKKNI